MIGDGASRAVLARTRRVRVVVERQARGASVDVEALDAARFTARYR